MYPSSSYEHLFFWKEENILTNLWNNSDHIFLGETQTSKAKVSHFLSSPLWLDIWRGRIYDAWNTLEKSLQRLYKHHGFFPSSLKSARAQILYIIHNILSSVVKKKQ